MGDDERSKRREERRRQRQAETGEAVEEEDTGRRSRRQRGGETQEEAPPAAAEDSGDSRRERRKKERDDEAQEEQRQQEEEQRRREQDARRRQQEEEEDARRAEELERKQAAEEQKKKDEAERKKREEQERKQQEAQRSEEDKKRKAEEDARRKAEEEDQAKLRAETKKNRPAKDFTHLLSGGGRKARIKNLLMQKAAEDLKAEAQKEAAERVRVINERVQPIELDGLGKSELVALLRQLHGRLQEAHGERWESEYKVRKTDLQINDLKSRATEGRGKFVKPTLKKVSKIGTAIGKTQKERQLGGGVLALNKVARPTKDTTDQNVQKVDLRAQLKRT